jgi:23S rRNA-/tRNA-specific pseudouridylate synthase
MIMGLTGKASGKLAEEFREGTVKKQYVARVKGKFPEYVPFEGNERLVASWHSSGDILVNQPLISVDRQMGLVIVAPEGKPAETVFTRMSYDAERDQSVVHCKSSSLLLIVKLTTPGRPQTGRSRLYIPIKADYQLTNFVFTSNISDTQ